MKLLVPFRTTLFNLSIKFLKLNQYFCMLTENIVTVSNSNLFTMPYDLGQLLPDAQHNPSLYLLMVLSEYLHFSL